MKLERLSTLIFIIISQFLFLNLAEAQFGKNRVQYEEFDFKYIQTEHFDIYYHQGGYDLATYCGIEAEKALKEIEFELNYSIKKRISFVVYNSHNQFQQNNIISQFLSENTGGVTTLFKNRIVIPFQGDYAQYQHVIFHELVHGVLNDMFHGGTLQTSISTNGFFMPTWLNEGLCEYLSNHGMDTETDMFMRDVVLNEKLPPLMQLGGYIQYRVGQTFYWYIAQKYGSEKVGEFINKMRVQKNLEKTFRTAFKMSMEDFSEQFENDIKKYYFPDIDRFESIKDFSEVVTDRSKMGNFYNTAPAISPNGERMAFISETDGLLGVSVMDIDDMSSRKSLVSSFRQQDFEDLNMLAPGISWNSEGTKISVSAKSGKEDAIFIVDPESGDYQKLSFDLRHISSVDWSPDGSKLCFVASEDEQSDIYVYDIDKSELINLTNDTYSDLFPVWANDSKSIFFISDRTDITRIGTENKSMWYHPVKARDIYRIQVEDSDIERITFDPWYDKTSIAVSSDDSQILYVSDNNGIGNLYVKDLFTGDSYPITNSLTGIRQISLAPDDSKLLYSCQIDGGYDIFMVPFPFTRQLDESDLPLTKYRQESDPSDKFTTIVGSNPSIPSVDVESINPTDINSQDSTGTEIISYGEYELSFENQEVVEPNPDAIQKTPFDISEIDSNFTPKDYKTKWSTDLVLGNPGYNTFFGFQGTGQALFSDELGNHQLYIAGNLFRNLQNSNIFARYSYLEQIIDYHVTGFFTGGQTLIYDVDVTPTEANVAGGLYIFNNAGFDFSAHYALDLFQRFEFGAELMTLSRSFIQTVTTGPEVASRPDISRYVAIPKVAYVLDNTLNGWYGPSRGTRMRFELMGSPKLHDEGLGFFAAEADMRQYFELNDFMTLALRGRGAYSGGEDALNYFLGGVDNWINRQFINGQLPFQDPEDFAFMNFEYPMRGWNLAQAQGSKMVVTNAELRTPLFYAIAAGGLPIFLQAIQLNIFADAGAAWDEELSPNRYSISGQVVPGDLLVSSGLGIRSIVLGLPLRVDVAWLKVPGNWSTPQWVVSLGGDW